MKGLFFLLSLLVSSGALAESASVTLSSLDSMRRANADNERLCHNIERNPGCVENAQLIERVLGMSVVGCEANLRSLQCASVVRNFPGFENHRMQCTPLNICRTALTSTFFRGCGRYGIQVRDEFTAAFRQMGQCFSDWRCIGTTFLRNAMTVVMPGLAIAQMGQSMAQEIRDDFDKAKNLSCFDPETQAQFACYLTVKYGMAATGVAGAARAGAAAMVGRMASFERMLFRAGRTARPSPRSIVRNLSTQMSSSGNFRLFKFRRGEAAFDGGALKPGESYVVLVHDGKLVFGEAYRNKDGGTAMTHLQLLRDLGERPSTRPYTGGAVRVNPDGSFDVSGYRRQARSESSMKAIEDLIRGAIPDARIRSTPGRLSELNP